MKKIIFICINLALLMIKEPLYAQQAVPFPNIDVKNEKFADIKEKLIFFMQQTQDTIKEENEDQGKEGPNTQLKRWIRQQETHLDSSGHIFNYTAKNWDEYLKIKPGSKASGMPGQGNPASGAVTNSSASGNNWQALNPTSYTANRPGEQGVGRIERLAVDPNNSTTIYAGAAVGGLWKSTDNGNTWNCITNNIPFESVTGIAINPSNSDNIFITTGMDAWWNFTDQYTFGNIAIKAQPDGLLVTYDGGNNWYSCNLLTSNHNMEAVAIAPLHNNIIVVGADNGVWQSTDGGNSWTQTLKGTNMNITDLKFLPNSDSCVVTANNGGVVVGSGSNFATIWYSTTAGASWSPAAFTPALSGIGIIRLAVTPANNSYVYAFVQGGGPSVSGTNRNNDYLYLSTNAGQSFQQQADITSITTGQGPTLGYNQGYANSIAVSGTSAAVVYIGDFNTYISTDYGIDNWTQIGNWDTVRSINNVHADAHDMLCIGGNELFCANDGGVFYSGNAGSAGMTFQYTAWQLNVAEYRGFGGTQDNPNLFYGGTQDDGQLEFSGGQLTGDLQFGDGYDAVIAPAPNSNIWYSIGSDVPRVYLNGSLTQDITPPLNPNCNCKDTVFFSAGIPGALPPVSTQMLQFNPLNPNIIYAMYRNFYSSTAGSSTWTYYPTGLQSIVTAFTEATYSTSGADNTNIFYAVQNGIQNGVVKSGYNSIYQSTTTGQSWNSLISISSANNISDIVVNPNNSGDVYIAYTGYDATLKVEELSVNGGAATVTNISSGLPNVPIYRIVYQNNTSPGIYVGTDIGVFFRPASTGEWLLFSDGLPYCHVVDLEINYNSNVISCATYGRGLWQAPLYGECPSTYTFVPGAVVAHEYIAASNEINCASAITGGYGDTVIFNSGNFISLTTGFSVDSPNIFSAYINGCSGPIGTQSVLRGDYAGPLNGATVVATTEPEGNFVWKIVPNPANNYVNISYSLPATSSVSISLFDLNGRQVKQIQENSNLDAGNHSVGMDISNLSNQVYFVRMICNGTSSVSKLVVSH